MKKVLIILTYILSTYFLSNAQQSDKEDFRWGNAYYFNINIGETIAFNDVKITLLQIKNHYNILKIGNDTIRLKVSRRSLPKMIKGLRIFVADNKNVKEITTDKHVHGLLSKDALICLSDFQRPLLDPNKYIFPISFNDGYQWSMEEDSHMFSYLGLSEWISNNYYRSHEGIDFDLHEARGIEKHWLVALENSTVVWVVKDANKDQSCVLLESESQPGIYYIYQHIYNKNTVVHKGQKLVRGEPIGTIWGDNVWGHLHLAIVKSDTIPTYPNRYVNVLNFFPQMFELYNGQTYNYSKSFSKGRIRFGQLRSLNGNEKNALAFEDYSGKGWMLGNWNKADKVEWILKGKEGNARLRKKLFAGTKTEAVNPTNFYNFEINVKSGVYRISAKVGDLFLPSWQKIFFEDIDAGLYDMSEGKMGWTPEKVVKVEDGKLTIRIFVDEKENKTAGLSEILFQQVY